MLQIRKEVACHTNVLNNIYQVRVKLIRKSKVIERIEITAKTIDDVNDDGIPV